MLFIRWQRVDICGPDSLRCSVSECLVIIVPVQMFAAARRLSCPYGAVG